MEFSKMTIDELQARKAEIAESVDNEEIKTEELEALEEEARGINTELESRAADEAKKVELRKLVAAGEVGTVIEESPEKQEERKNMENKIEFRNSKEYMNAYAEFIKTGDDAECRKILTTNAEEGGVLPVPDIVAETIQTAWEREDIMGRVRSTNLRGNVKVGFELSATGAVVHKEGDAAPAEEELTFGIVTMIPETIKKWISISDEALAMGGAEFLAYIYDELTYRIAKKCAEILIEKITSLPATATETSVSADVITAAPALGTVAEALAHLASGASNPVILMNRLTWAEFKKVEYAGQFPVDPFEGLEVVFTDALPAYATATGTYAIVGDLYGAQANYPEGDAIRIRFNDLSRAKEDIVEIVGRRYVGLGITRDKHFALIQKSNG